MTINVHAAKTHFSKLLERVENGQEVVIARYGRAVARLVPIGKPTAPRRLGTLKGRIQVASDFDSPLPRKVLRRFLAGS